MIILRVTPPIEEEGAEVDGAEGVEGAIESNCLDRNYASLCLMVVASIAHITWIRSDMGKGTKKQKKWHKSLVIAEGKMSLPRVVVSLYTSMIE